MTCSITPEMIIIKLNNKNISNNMSPGSALISAEYSMLCIVFRFSIWLQHMCSAQNIPHELDISFYFQQKSARHDLNRLSDQKFDSFT